MKTAVVGLGLIGGSMAIDLRKEGIATSLLGVEHNEKNAKRALELGLADEILPLEEALKLADLVITAIPVNAMKTVLTKILDAIGDKVIVIDTGSTKSQICKA